MPITYSLIASNTLTTSAASVTFSAIPNTFTDLVFRFSSRDDIGTSGLTFYLSPNASTTNNSTTLLWSTGSGAFSNRFSTSVGLYLGWVNGIRTANTFSNGEVYIPNYAGSTNKVFSSTIMEESNSTSDTRMAATAGLWSNTSAISSFVVRMDSGTNFVAGSSFFLYGIKNT